MPISIRLEEAAMLKTIAPILLLFMLAVISEYANPAQQMGNMQSAMVTLR
jgi:hypothetical protein